MKNKVITTNLWITQVRIFKPKRSFLFQMIDSDMARLHYDMDTDRLWKYHVNSSTESQNLVSGCAALQQVDLEKKCIQSRRSVLLKVSTRILTIKSRLMQSSSTPEKFSMLHQKYSSHPVPSIVPRSLW